MKKFDIAVLGGCGHIGLPLSFSFAKSNLRVVAIDKNEEIIKKIQKKELPYKENGLQKLLKKKYKISFSNKISEISYSKFIISLMRFQSKIKLNLNPF